MKIKDARSLKPGDTVRMAAERILALCDRLEEK